jgi:hypothetical protein
MLPAKIDDAGKFHVCRAFVDGPEVSPESTIIDGDSNAGGEHRFDPFHFVRFVSEVPREWSEREPVSEPSVLLQL